MIHAVLLKETKVMCTNQCMYESRVGIGQVKQKHQGKIAIIFLSISCNMCFGCSKEQSHRDGSFEYPQHMFWLRNKKNIVLLKETIVMCTNQCMYASRVGIGQVEQKSRPKIAIIFLSIS